MLVVTALLGFVVSAPAQRNSDGRYGRHSRGTVIVNQQPRVQSTNRSYQRVGRARTTQRSRHVGRVPVRGQRIRGQALGHWETRCERVLVPGYWTTECVPATYGWVFDACGNRRWGIVQPGYTHRVWVPARYETQTRRVWVRH